MEDFKLREVYKEYRNINARYVEWIIGLEISQLILILTLELYNKDILFYLFIFSTFITIIFAMVIMYAVTASIDIDFYIGVLSKSKKINNNKEFKDEYKKRLGKITNWVLQEVLNGKIYKGVFLTFMIGTILMMLLVFKYI